MSIDFYIKLILAVYRVTELFPKRETLKVKIRQAAGLILVDLVKHKNADLLRRIEEIKKLFGEAEAKNLVNARNFLVLKKEYDRLGKTVENLLINPSREEKILEVLKAKKEVKLRDLTQVFPQVSKRTLIRDMERLFQTGLVLKAGSGPASCYNIKIMT